jgi:hypothetical protein
MGRFVWCVEEIWGEAVLNLVVDDEAVARRQRLCPGGGTLVREMEAEKMESWMGHRCEQEQGVGLGDIIGGVFGGVLISGCVFGRVFSGGLSANCFLVPFISLVILLIENSLGS